MNGVPTNTVNKDVEPSDKHGSICDSSSTSEEEGEVDKKSVRTPRTPPISLDQNVYELKADCGMKL